MAGRVYDYGRLRGTASRLIGRFGLAAELRQDGVDYPVTVVLTDYRASQFRNEHIMKGDFIALLAATGTPVVPKPGSFIFWEGRERNIVDVTVTKPGPQAVMYQLQIRGVR